jgi:hypothetical protein
MNKAEIAEQLRREVGELEITIKKTQARCDKLKRFVLDLEEELGMHRPPEPERPSEFRKVIDKVFGERPKRPKG